MGTVTDSATIAPAVPATDPLPHAALAGRTVAVVGGSSGIGLAAAELLRDIGARVVLVGRNEQRLEAAAARVRKAGTDEHDAVLAFAADGTDEDALAAVLDRAGSVDHVLVTAATVTGGPLADADRSSVEDAVNSRLWGAYAAARAAQRRLPAGGSLTFFSGTYTVRPIPGAAAAIAGAGALESLTRALAVELAPSRVRVNTVRAGVIDTPLARAMSGATADDDAAVAQAGSGMPLGRWGSAGEAAAAALFLMANNYATGSVLTLDGGQSLA